MFNPKEYENSLGDGHGVLTFADNPKWFIPLRKTELKGTVIGPLAELKVIQTFSFTKAQFDKPIEAMYRFPLPGDAAVTGVRVKFGGFEISTELKAREKAKQEYEQAKSEGKQAILTERTPAPDVFSLAIAGIQPDEVVTVETSFTQLAKSDEDSWILRVPLTTAPRYYTHPPVIWGAAPAVPEQGPLAVLRDPEHKFSMEVVVRGGDTVSSATHELALSSKDNKITVNLKDGEVIPNSDFVLKWNSKKDPKRPSLSVYTHDESEYTYFMALANPPAVKDAGNKLPRETIILIDQSGSMDGTKLPAATYAAKHFLSTMSESDTFALGFFESKVHWMHQEPVHATTDNLANAEKALNQLRSLGGTEFVPALQQSIEKMRQPGNVARHILIITDAQIGATETEKCIALAETEFKRPDRRRVSVICIDSAPNTMLVEQMTDAAGGESKILSSAPGNSDICSALNNILSRWEEPVLTDLILDIDREGAQTSKVKCDFKDGHSFIDIGDLPAGKAVWVSGRVPKQEGKLTFALKSQTTLIRSAYPEGYSFRPAIKALFGAKRILALENIKNFAEKKQDKILNEMGYANIPMSVAELIGKESVEFGLPSTEASFVGVRKDVNAKVEGTVQIPNALPQNWSEAFVGLQGITGHSGVSGFSGSAGVVGVAGVFVNHASDSFDSYGTSTKGTNIPYPKMSAIVQPEYTLPGGQSQTNFSQPQFHSPMHTPQNWQLPTGALNRYERDLKAAANVVSRRGAVPDSIEPEEKTSGGITGSAAGYRKHMNIVDDSQQKQLNMNLMNPGEFVMSTQTLAEKFDLHYDDEVERLRLEAQLSQRNPVFQGTPAFTTSGQALLYEGIWPQIINEIEILFDVPGDLSKTYIEVFVGNEVVARARIKLSDFVKYSIRPLSLGYCTEKLKILLTGDAISVTLTMSLK